MEEMIFIRKLNHRADLHHQEVRLKLFIALDQLRREFKRSCRHRTSAIPGRQPNHHIRRFGSTSGRSLLIVLGCQAPHDLDLSRHLSFLPLHGEPRS